MMSHLPIWKEHLHQLQKETKADEQLQALKRIILSGWPDDKGKCPILITTYYHIRDELSVQDGWIFMVKG